MLLDEIAQTSAEVAATSARLGKVSRLAACLERADPGEVRVVVAYLSGVLPQGSVGIGWASLRDLPSPVGLPATLSVRDADAAVSRIAAIAGPGSQAARRSELSDLFTRATEPEQRFLAALFVGELRQGAVEGVVTDAVAKAARLPATAVRRALMVAGDLGVVAEAALGGGSEELARFGLTVLAPVKPMLAQTAASVEEALARVGPARLEWKLDGARLQVHRRGDGVRAFTRNLADITDRIPEIVEAVLALAVESVILDGEAIALRAGRTPAPVPSDDEPLRKQAGESASRGRSFRSRRSSSTASTSTATISSIVRPASGWTRSCASLPARSGSAARDPGRREAAQRSSPTRSRTATRASW